LRTPKVAVLIPAYNEERGIEAALQSVLSQTRVPDIILVIPHNCTDSTAVLARGFDGVDVVELDNDPRFTNERKTAPLNYGMDILLNLLDENDFILPMDADTQLSPELVERALAHFARNERLGAVSAHHLVQEPHGLLQRLQQMEMERGMYFANRRAGRRTCMSGMCSVFRVATLRQIKAEHGRIYESWNSTEDWMLTFAIKDAGWLDRRPADLILSYQPVTTWKALFQQRERWGRGYMETLWAWGLRRFTIWPWTLQAWGFVSSTAFLLFLALICAQQEFHLTPWLLIVTFVLTANAVMSVRRAGWKAALIAGLIIPELAYLWVINTATFRGIAKQFAHREMQWADVREK
jgi:poly-beta-1,6-N-acetyl-D-glucosamine synthase